MPSALPSGLLLLRDLIIWCYHSTLAGTPIYLVLQQSQGLKKEERGGGRKRIFWSVILTISPEVGVKTTQIRLSWRTVATKVTNIRWQLHS